MSTINNLARKDMDLAFHLSSKGKIETTNPTAIALTEENKNSYFYFVNLLSGSKGVSQASHLTDNIHEAKKFCVDGIVCIGHSIQRGVYHTNPSLKRAGEFLELEFEAFSSPHNLPLDDLISTCAVIKETFTKPSLLLYSEELLLIEVIDSIYEKSLVLVDLLQRRAMEKSGMSIPEIEEKCADCYEAIIQRANASIILNPTQEGNDFAVYMNTLISERKLSVKKHNANKQKENPTNPTEPTVEENIQEIKMNVQDIKEELL